ncbi:hypothetical protein [Haliangium ochraceum]|uniref:PEGA domain-containing protein n=1 Tax=Haliangium ochraceum (strain DSM 14365 / JCM 11303 / SMP-2) TaxID=502025 RepID=D0LKL0_HALO1|nr:hypothetical protein [Haliangium ochraceum]ACY15058.1 hypothetical protein Hoch_2522 [Haliangium ochraceum DSM 14365]
MALAAAWVAFAGGSARAETVLAAVRAPAQAPVQAAELAAAVQREAAAAGVSTSGEEQARERVRAHLADDGGGAGAQLAASAQQARVEALAERGWQAYLAAEPALAADRLSEARRLAEALLPLPGGIARYADLCLRLGVVYLQLGRGEEADALLRLAAVLAPEREVSIAAFAPDVVAAYERARDLQPPRTRLSVAVWLAAAGLEAISSARPSIEIDGRPVGAAPQSLEVATGLHVVVARGLGYRSSAQVIAAVAGQTPLSLTLEAEPAAAAALAPSALALGRADAQAQAALVGLLRYAELDAAVLVASAWRGGAAVLLGQRCVRATESALACTEIVEVAMTSAESFDDAALTPDDAATRTAMAALWRRLHGEQAASLSVSAPTLLADPRLTHPESAPVLTMSGHQGRARWYRNRWLWLGVGVATTAAAALTWGLTRDGERDSVIVVDPCEFAACP